MLITSENLERTGRIIKKFTYTFLYNFASGTLLAASSIGDSTVQCHNMVTLPNLYRSWKTSKNVRTFCGSQTSRKFNLRLSTYFMPAKTRMD